MCLKSSMAEKRGPHKDCALVEALHTCIYVHSHGREHTNRHRDAWARVRPDNLAKDEMDKMELRRSMRTSDYV